MTDILRHSDTCTVQSTGKSVEAVVHEFKVEDRLVVVLNQSVKLAMKWNGRIYEGKMAGLDFTSNGPSYKTTKATIRG